MPGSLAPLAVAAAVVVVAVAVAGVGFAAPISAAAAAATTAAIAAVPLVAGHLALLLTTVDSGRKAALNVSQSAIGTWSFA